jgi:dihydrofolate reductase
MRLTAVAALDHAAAIGSRGGLPWSLPADLRRFRDLTMGHPIVMGRATFASIGRPLPGRRNLVVSRNPAFAAPEPAETFAGLDAALGALADADEAFVIGGATLYEQALDRLDRMVLTVVHHTFDDTDVFYPAFSLHDWRIESRVHYDADERNAWAQTVWDLRREPGAGVDQVCAPGALAPLLRG